MSGFGGGGFGGDVASGGMTFGEILDAVCTDGIDAKYRGAAKVWVVNRLARLWQADNWTFKQATSAITFTANSQIVSGAPSDVQNVYALYDQNGDPIRGETDIRRFFDQFNTLGDASVSGWPQLYTVVDGQILVGPQGDGSTGLVVYQAQKPTLLEDSDQTGLPDGFDLALVFGAKATGYKLTNNPLADELEQEYQAQIADLANDWLDSVLETGGQMGAYRPGLARSAYR